MTKLKIKTKNLLKSIIKNTVLEIIRNKIKKSKNMNYIIQYINE